MFAHTAFHKPTLTTVNDPTLKVYEIDNGLSWTLKFYASNTLIDVINLEHCRGSKLHSNVMKLPVLNEENKVIGTVLSVINNAVSY